MPLGYPILSYTKLPFGWRGNEWAEVPRPMAEKKPVLPLIRRWRFLGTALLRSLQFLEIASDPCGIAFPYWLLRRPLCYDFCACLCMRSFVYPGVPSNIISISFRQSQTHHRWRHGLRGRFCFNIVFDSHISYVLCPCAFRLVSEVNRRILQVPEELLSYEEPQATWRSIGWDKRSKSSRSRDSLRPTTYLLVSPTLLPLVKHILIGSNRGWCDRSLEELVDFAEAIGFHKSRAIPSMTKDDVAQQLFKSASVQWVECFMSFDG